MLKWLRKHSAVLLSGLIVAAMLVMAATPVFAEAAANAAPAVQAAQPESVSWITVASRFAADLVPIIGSAIGALILWGLRSLLSRWKLENVAGIQEILESATAKGVAYAEQWAANQVKDGRKPTGSEKLDKAFEVVETIIGQQKVQQIGREQINKLIEASLHININGASSI